VDVAAPIGRHGVPQSAPTSAVAAGFRSDVDPLNTH